MQRDGRPLADVRAAQLQRTDDVLEAGRVQELPRHGREQHESQLHQAHHGFVLIVGQLKKTVVEK